jgi:uncharacterized spore protein YtfJ
MGIRIWYSAAWACIFCLEGIYFLNDKPTSAGPFHEMGIYMSLQEIIQTALDRMQFIAKTETIIGEPIQVGGVTLIPVSKISIGFAAGGGGKEEKAGSGAGTGGGLNVVPVAVISICGDKVQVLPIEPSDAGLSALLAKAPDLIKKAAKFMKKDSAAKKEDHTHAKESSDEKGA